MKYQETVYAKALLQALRGKSESEKKEVAKNFLNVLKKNSDLNRLNSILDKVEIQYLKDEKIRKLSVESASPLSKDSREEIKSSLGGKVLLEERVRPELLAGARIILDGEILIDATAFGRLAKIFH